MSINAPFYFDYINAEVAKHSPSTVHTANTHLFHYFSRYLLQKAFAVYKWELPENWSEDYFLYVLYTWGTVAVVKTNKYGVIPQGCSLRGYDVFYQPKYAVISNPLLKGITEPEIGRQTELIRISRDYGGMFDKIAFYADLMAVTAEAAGINILNSKLAYVYAASNKGMAESFKKMYDKIASGDPAVVVDKDLLDENGNLNVDYFAQNLSQNYIAGDLLADLRKIELMFCTDVGIPNTNTDKKERMTDDEVTRNNVEVFAAAEARLELLQQCCEKVNTMFELNVSVDWRYPPEMQMAEQESGGVKDERDTESSGTL